MNDNFEQKLKQLKIKQASIAYQTKANALLNEISSKQKGFNWSFIWALGLMLSVGLNFYLYSHSIKNGNQSNLVAKQSVAQKQTHGYSIKQGAMIPYDGNNDVTIILEN